MIFFLCNYINYNTGGYRNLAQLILVRNVTETWIVQLVLPYCFQHFDSTFSNDEWCRWWLSWCKKWCDNIHPENLTSIRPYVVQMYPSAYLPCLLCLYKIRKCNTWLVSLQIFTKFSRNLAYLEKFLGLKRLQRFAAATRKLVDTLKSEFG